MADDEAPGVWDPLWEYVLNDYDIDPRTRKKPSRRVKIQVEATERGNNSYLSDGGDSRSDYETSTRREASRRRSESSKSRGSADHSESRLSENSNQRHPWRRNKPATSMDESKTERSRTAEREDAVNVPTEYREIRQSASGKSTEECESPKSLLKKGNSDTGSSKRKRFFKRRFRKSDDESREENSVTFDDTAHVREFRIEPTQAPSPVPQREVPPPNQGYGSNQQESSIFDPFAMLFDVAEQLDPWGTDDDSYTTLSVRTEGTDERTNQTDDRTQQTDDRTHQTDDRTHQTDDGTAQTDGTNQTDDEVERITNGRELRSISEPNINEIRLQHTPKRERRKSETQEMQGVMSTFGSAFSLFENDADRQDDINLIRHERVYASEDQNLISDDRNPDQKQPFLSPLNLSRSRASRDEDDFNRVDQNSLIVDSQPSEDQFFRAPSNIRESSYDPSTTVPVEVKPKRRSKNPFKRLVCCGIKEGSLEKSSSNLVAQASQESELFPRTRMIPDSNPEKSSSFRSGDDSVDNVHGVPTEEIANSKGTNSVYTYDNVSNEHVDLVYTHFTKEPRVFVVPRTHGSPPKLDSAAGDDVIVKVEASTVSDTDCCVRGGTWWGPEEVPLPNTPGVDMIGKVYHIKQKTTKTFGLKPGQNVVSLMKWGGNSRYIQIDPSQLVVAPEGIDAAQAACLPETYLTAFQCLHFGQVGAIRYRQNSLKGQSILVLGFMSNQMGRALIELALNAGAATIYATAKKKHWKTLISYGVMPLDQDASIWIHRIEGTIDLVLAANGSGREDVAPIHVQALNDYGRLILCGTRLAGNDMPVGDWKKTNNQLICAGKSKMKMKHRTHAYDVFEQWEKDLETCKNDLRHLLNLLSHNAVKPNVLDRIPLGKVGKAQELLETKRLSGFLVCEPWLQTKKRVAFV